MSTITYTIEGANTDSLSNTLDNLRNNSSQFRNLESQIGAQYNNVVIVMGPGVVPEKNLIGIDGVGAGGKSVSDPNTYYIFLDTTSVGQVAGQNLSVDQVLVHELAHAAQPPAPAGAPFGLGTQSVDEEKAVIAETNSISSQMGWNANTGFPQFNSNTPAVCTANDPSGLSQNTLRFADGTVASVGTYDPNLPTAQQNVFGIKKLEESGDSSDGIGTTTNLQDTEVPATANWQESYTPVGLGVDTVSVTDQADLTTDNFNADGSLLQSYSLNEDGSLVGNIFGQGVEVPITDATINLDVDAPATVIGDGNAINLEEGSSATVTGNDEALVQQSGTTVDLTGTNEVVNASDSIVALGSDTSVTVAGTNNTIVGQSGSDTITVAGSGDTVTASGDTISDNGFTGAAGWCRRHHRSRQLEPVLRNDPGR